MCLTVTVTVNVTDALPFNAPMKLAVAFVFTYTFVCACFRRAFLHAHDVDEAQIHDKSSKSDLCLFVQKDLNCI